MMTEQEFISKLSNKLSFLNFEDRVEIIESYQQQFSEMRAEGMTDSQIINTLESIDDIVENIRKEFNVSKQEEYQARFKEKYTGYKESINDYLKKDSKETSTNMTAQSLMKVWQLILKITKIIITTLLIFILIMTIVSIPFVMSIFGVNLSIMILYGFIFLFEITSYSLLYKFINYLGDQK